MFQLREVTLPHRDSEVGAETFIPTGNVVRKRLRG